MENITEFYSKIVGSTFCEGSQERIKKLKSGELLIALREPENKFDANAIAIYAEDKQRLGYIPRNTAVELSKQMDAKGINVQISVSEITGEGKDNCGCNLKIEVFGNPDMLTTGCDATESDIY